MNMAQKKLYLLLVCTMLCIFQIQFAFGQEKFVINGNLKDQLTGEVIIRAVVRIEELPNLGVLSNEYGFYAIALPKGKYTLLITQLGYEKYKQQVTLEENISINIFLKPANLLKEVVVESGRKNDNLLKPQMLEGEVLIKI